MLQLQSGWLVFSILCSRFGSEERMEAKHNWDLCSSSDVIILPNTVISPNFLVWKFCGKAQFRKLRFSVRLPHQEIRWNYGVLCSNCVCRNAVGIRHPCFVQWYLMVKSWCKQVYFELALNFCDFLKQSNPNTFYSDFLHISWLPIHFCI